jgi:pimeloyl-ACP methyl ester carboxylesterase
MTTWILLRGLTREVAHWGPFPDQFSRAMPGAQVVTLDLPGNGAFHRQGSPWSVHGMAVACQQEMQRRGMAPPYSLLAMSLGAMVATEWAKLAPADIERCVLVNTSFRPFSSFRQRLRPRNYAKLLRLALLPGNAAAVEATVLRLTSNHVDRHADALRQWAAIRGQRPVSGGNAIRQLVAAARYRAPASAPCSKTLLLGSANDQLVHSGCSAAIAAAWVCPLVLHPDAGHDLPLDDPDWVVKQVKTWWEHPDR